MQFTTPRDAIVNALKHHKRHRRTTINLNRPTEALQKELFRIMNRNTQIDHTPLVSRAEIITHLKRFKLRKMSQVKLHQSSQILIQELRRLVRQYGGYIGQNFVSGAIVDIVLDSPWKLESGEFVRVFYTMTDIGNTQAYRYNAQGEIVDEALVNLSQLECKNWSSQKTLGKIIGEKFWKEIRKRR